MSGTGWKPPAHPDSPTPSWAPRGRCINVPGERTAGAKRVTADTPFLWGSVAKPVTATAVLTLVQDGRLGLDDPVVDHLPAFRFGGPAHAGKVTVRHLLEQTSGLPESATFDVADCYDADCPPPAGRLAALDRIEPTGPPGTDYTYTSANYLVLTAVIEAVTHRPFAEYVRRAVLTPAGMDTAIADRASAREQHLPPGHQLLWGRHPRPSPTRWTTTEPATATWAEPWPTSQTSPLCSSAAGRPPAASPC